MLRVPGTDLLLFSTPFSQHARANLTIFSSRDSGASWQFERTVDGGSSAYSALIDVNTSHFGVAWETNNYGAITFVTLPLPTHVRMKSDDSVFLIGPVRMKTYDSDGPSPSSRIAVATAAA